jgi:hypothetical protein
VDDGTDASWTLRPVIGDAPAVVRPPSSRADHSPIIPVTRA